MQVRSSITDRTAPKEDVVNIERSPHQHLRLFEIQDGQGHGDRLVEMATYISDNCVALRKMYMHHPTDAYVDELGEWEEHLKQQLQGQLPNYVHVRFIP